MRDLRSVFYEVIADWSKGIHLLAQGEPFFVEISQQIQHNRRFLTHNSLIKSRTISIFPYHVRILGYGLSGGFHLEHPSNVSFRGDDETQCVHLWQVLLY